MLCSLPFCFKEYLPQAYAYADDTQLYLLLKADSSTAQNDAMKAMENCITAIRAWMIEDKLCLNDSKTEFMIVGTRQQLAKVNIDQICVGESSIVRVTSVKNLGSTKVDLFLFGLDSIHPFSIHSLSLKSLKTTFSFDV